MSCSLYNDLFEKNNFRSLCQIYDLAVIEYAPKDEVLSLASEADILPVTGKEGYQYPKLIKNFYQRNVY